MKNLKWKRKVRIGLLSALILATAQCAAANERLEEELFLQPAILRTFMEPDHFRRWHSTPTRHFTSQVPRLGFQQSS